MKCRNHKHINCHDEHNQIFFQDRLDVQQHSNFCQANYRSSFPEVFLGKVVLKICSTFTGEEHPCRRAISIKLLCMRACVFSCKFATYFQNTFLKNTSGRLLLELHYFSITVMRQCSHIENFPKVILWKPHFKKI